MVTLFSLFADIERELISLRTKEGLAAARAAGKHLGRPKGKLGWSKLSGKEDEIQGSRVRRDNWVSVRYAEELNSSKSSVLLQRADRHEILGEKPPDFQVSL
jgi:DNA invertase Pin-like site-specific DNA recombinase